MTCPECGAPLDPDVIHIAHTCGKVEGCGCPEVCADCCTDPDCALREPQETTMTDPAPLTDDEWPEWVQRAAAFTPTHLLDRLVATVEQARSERDAWERIAVTTGGVDRAEQFWSRVAKSNGCWIWSGPCDSDGYGKVTWSGRFRRAHRVAYELSIGPIPEGLQLDHLCRDPGCVNPAHLEPVTHQENMRRGLHGGLTTHCPAGHPYDETNTYRPPGTNQQRCRTCLREHSARYRERIRARTQSTEDEETPS